MVDYFKDLQFIVILVNAHAEIQARISASTWSKPAMHCQGWIFFSQRWSLCLQWKYDHSEKRKRKKNAVKNFEMDDEISSHTFCRQLYIPSTPRSCKAWDLGSELRHWVLELPLQGVSSTISSLRQFWKCTSLSVNLYARLVIKQYYQWQSQEFFLRGESIIITMDVYQK